MSTFLFVAIVATLTCYALAMGLTLLIATLATEVLTNGAAVALLAPPPSVAPGMA